VNVRSISSLFAVEGFVASLQRSCWVKFICGASNHDVALIRNLCYIYTSAGVDCIDLSAVCSPIGYLCIFSNITISFNLLLFDKDPAILFAAHEGVQTALFKNSGFPKTRPLLMISVNDDEDLHFRKAEFDPKICPISCSRPCEKVYFFSITY